MVVPRAGRLRGRARHPLAVGERLLGQRDRLLQSARRLVGGGEVVPRAGPSGYRRATWASRRNLAQVPPPRAHRPYKSSAGGRGRHPVTASGSAQRTRPGMPCKRAVNATGIGVTQLTAPAPGTRRASRGRHGQGVVAGTRAGVHQIARPAPSQGFWAAGVSDQAAAIAGRALAPRNPVGLLWPDMCGDHSGRWQQWS